MQWLHLLAKLSPERVQPILREGQCKSPSDYNDELNMPSDHHGSPPEQFEANSEHGSSSIGDSSLLAPPISHRQPHNYLGPQHEPHQLQSFLDGIPISQSPPLALATTMNPGSTGAALVSMRAINHIDYSNGVALTNPDPLSPHPSWMHGQAPLPNVPPPQQQPLVYRDGYAPAESLPPQTYIPARTVPASSAPFVRPGSRGVPALLQAQAVTPPVLSIQTVVPPNSELAQSPRFTFAPPGAYVPADPITSTTTGPPSPASARSWRDKGRVKIDQAARQPMQEGSAGRARSNSWTVVSSVFRRRSGRRPAGPAPLTTDAPPPPPPQLTASNWRDLAHWAYPPSDHLWGESFASRVDIAPPINFEASSNLYGHSLPPLPSHLSHLPAPSAPLLRTDSSSSALNPFLVHRHTGVPPLLWDLRTSARSILFPTSSAGPGPGGAAPLPAVPMASSDYAQLATWPPCGALRIGAIGGRASVWRWPVDVRNPVGVRCGDVFRALIANLHQFVRPDELADMLPEHVALAAAVARARIQLHSSTGTATAAAAAMDDGIRRVDCLLGHAQFCGLVPGPSPGEWTMYVGVP